MDGWLTGWWLLDWWWWWWISFYVIPFFSRLWQTNVQTKEYMDRKASIPSAKQEPSAIHLFSQSIYSISIDTYRFHPFKSLIEPIFILICVYTEQIWYCNIWVKWKWKWRIKKTKKYIKSKQFLLEKLRKTEKMILKNIWWKILFMNYHIFFFYKKKNKKSFRYFHFL